MKKKLTKAKCDRLTDRQTDRAGCRVACTRLKNTDFETINWVTDPMMETMTTASSAPPSSGQVTITTTATTNNTRPSTLDLFHDVDPQQQQLQQQQQILPTAFQLPMPQQHEPFYPRGEFAYVRPTRRVSPPRARSPATTCYLDLYDDQRRGWEI